MIPASVGVYYHFTMGKNSKVKESSVKGKGKQSGGGGDEGGSKGKGKGKGGKSADGLGTCTYVKGLSILIDPAIHLIDLSLNLCKFPDPDNSVLRFSHS